MVYVVDFKVVVCIALKCDHVLCPVQCLFLQKMTGFKEQCICNKLLFQIGKTGAENFQVLTFAFREEAMRQTIVFGCSAKYRNWKDTRQGCRIFRMSAYWHKVQKCGTYLWDLARKDYFPLVG